MAEKCEEVITCLFNVSSNVFVLPNSIKQHSNRLHMESLEGRVGLCEKTFRTGDDVSDSRPQAEAQRVKWAGSLCLKEDGEKEKERLRSAGWMNGWRCGIQLSNSVIKMCGFTAKKYL